MKLHNEALLTKSLRRGLALSAGVAMLAACSTSGDAGPVNTALSGSRADGPQADFPILIGAPYTINGVNYTPVDTLNYDEVGKAILDAGAMGVTGAHHTLPVPSYVEVTSLETGRTILVRLERRGPMMSNDLIALSPAALAQLEGEAGLAVRVRRVNPPEEQRAMLRAGNMVPLRMDTPMSLVSVLRRNLPADTAPEPVPQPPVAVAPADPLALPDVVAEPVEAAAVPETPAIEPLEVAATDRDTGRTAPVPSADADGFFVQAAAFSTQERADRAAQALDAFVLPGGQFFRVRTGPFATREEASASLAKVRAAGYDDARILEGGWNR